MGAAELGVGPGTMETEPDTDSDADRKSALPLAVTDDAAEPEHATGPAEKSPPPVALPVLDIHTDCLVV